MDAVAIILFIISLVLFFMWLIDGNANQYFMSFATICLLLSLILGVSTINAGSKDFMVKNCIITDHYKKTYFSHKVAIYPVEVRKKYCFFSTRYMVVFEKFDQKTSVSVSDICNILKDKLSSLGEM